MEPSYQTKEIVIPDERVNGENEGDLESHALQPPSLCQKQKTIKQDVGFQINILRFTQDIFWNDKKDVFLFLTTVYDSIPQELQLQKN